MQRDKLIKLHLHKIPICCVAFSHASSRVHDIIGNERVGLAASYLTRTKSQ